jgi:hypothetical protein
MLCGLARRIPAAADITKHLVGGFAVVVALGQHPVQRLGGDLGGRIPDRDLDRADPNRALAVSAGFFVLHHNGENFLRSEIVTGFIDERTRLRLEDAWNEPGAHLRAAGITAGRVEGKAADRLAVAFDIGDDGDHRRRHFGKIDARIGER